MRIKVEPLLPTGNYLNVRIGIEKDYPDTANEMDSVFEVWDNIIAMHMKRYPHLYNEKGEPLYEKVPDEEYRGTTVKTIEEKEQQVDKVPNELQDALDGIEKCETPDELKNWWTLSKSNLMLSVAYKSKEKQLHDAK